MLLYFIKLKTPLIFIKTYQYFICHHIGEKCYQLNYDKAIVRWILVSEVLKRKQTNKSLKIKETERSREFG